MYTEKEDWIKLHKSLLDWEWYSNSKMLHLWIHILLSANKVDKKWQGIEIKRGQFVTSLIKIASYLNLSIRTIRTNLLRLQKSKDIVIKTTNRYTIITIVNYSIAQDSRIKNDKQIIHQKDKQNINEINSKYKQNKITLDNKITRIIDFSINIKDRKENFKKEVYKYQLKNTPEKLLNFFNYWSEEINQGEKLKFENVKEWNTEAKLKAWIDIVKKNDENIKTKKHPLSKIGSHDKN
jgi:hypothetical protein